MRSCVGGNCDVEDVSWLCQVQVAPVLMCLDICGSGGEFRFFVWDDIVVMVICDIARET